MKPTHEVTAPRGERATRSVMATEAPALTSALRQLPGALVVKVLWTRWLLVAQPEWRFPVSAPSPESGDRKNQDHRGKAREGGGPYGGSLVGRLVVQQPGFLEPGPILPRPRLAVIADSPEAILLALWQRSARGKPLRSETERDGKELSGVVPFFCSTEG